MIFPQEQTHPFSHDRLCKDLKTGSQTIITGGMSSKSLVFISYNDSIIWSELIWPMYVVLQYFSYSCCDNIKATFNATFSRIIPGRFSINSSKISWYLNRLALILTGLNKWKNLSEGGGEFIKNVGQFS